MSDMFDIKNINDAKTGYAYLWVEKYRAKNVKNIILPAPVTKMFNKFIEEKEIPNLFFYSTSPGTGKTTSAKALLNDCEYEYKVINASKDSGVDTLRSEIVRYAKTFSSTGLKKAIVLDEFDGASHQFQQALRATMEDVHDNCRFIIICNNSSRIIAPLKSRVQSVCFDFTSGKQKEVLSPRIVNRLTGILNHEGITYEKDAIVRFVDMHFPDVRKMLNTLQMFSKQNEMITNDIFNVERINQELWDYILGCKYVPAIKYVLTNNYDYDELYGLMYREFLPLVPNGAKAGVIDVLAEHCVWSSQVVHKDLIFSDTLVKIMEVLREAAS